MFSSFHYYSNLRNSLNLPNYFNGYWIAHSKFTYIQDIFHNTCFAIFQNYAVAKILRTLSAWADPEVDNPEIHLIKSVSKVSWYFVVSKLDFSLISQTHVFGAPCNYLSTAVSTNKSEFVLCQILANCCFTEEVPPTSASLPDPFHSLFRQ